MSYQAINWAYEVALRQTPKAVLVALANFADESNECFPGQERLAKMAGVSVRTVSRALKDLEELGLIRRSSRYRDNGWRTSDRYVLAVGDQLPDNLTTGQSDHRSSSAGLPDSDDVTTGHSDGAIEPSVEPLVEPSDLLPDSPATGDVLFDQLWLLWPAHRRGTRKKSGSSFRSALKAVGGRRNADLIMDAAARHSGIWATWPESEKNYVPEMTTWLNQERWTGKDPDARGNAAVKDRPKIPKNQEWMYR